MLFLLAIATIVLPSVLGDCCMPSLYQSTIFDSSGPNVPMDIIISHDQKKMYFSSWDKTSRKAWTLVDYTNKNVYIQYRDGKCSIRSVGDTLLGIPQCPGNSTKSNGLWTLGEKENVITYRVTGLNSRPTHLALTRDNCYPTVAMIGDSGAQTIVFVDVKVGKDVEEDKLNPDLSECKRFE